jgi:hypothetical protein
LKSRQEKTVKINRIRAASFRILALSLCAAGFLLAATSGGQAVTSVAGSGGSGIGKASIAGVSIVVRNKSGAIVGRGETDADGAARIYVAVGDLNGDGRLDYTLEIDGESLVRAVDRLQPPPKRDDGPSVSLGAGGFLGGGSSGSHAQGAGPDQGSHGHSHSGGGVGLGLTLPLTGHGDSDPDQSGAPELLIALLLPAVQPARGATADTGSTTTFEVPYCRDAASRGMRIGFAIPPLTDPGSWTGRLSIKF